jgi:hypothetical protein
MQSNDRRGGAGVPQLKRRDLLRGGALGLGWLGAGAPALSASRGPLERQPDRAVILLLLVGGPSQLETWDPKPDAPREVRGPFGSIATCCPGVRVCEHLPRLAMRMNHLALVRSVYHEESPIHETGCQLLQTGRLCRAGERAPHFGSVVATIAGARNGLPASVLLPGPIESTGIDIPHGQSPGWLGDATEPVALGANGVGLTEEPEKLRDEYGRTSFGQSCLLARRLVEAGARVVTVNMFQNVFNQVTWDCHGAAPFSTLDDYARIVLPDFDRAFAALIDDLTSRGRLESTLVVAAGEFGRTPRINSAGGRDHWPGVWSIALAGGGIRAGQVVGASDAEAAYPAERPVTLKDVLASIYHSMGIDARQHLSRPGGEPFALVEGGYPIRELFG